MEVCVESIESARNAVAGGAIRIELCSALSEGGLTPSVGLFKAMKSVINIPIFVMIRPRSGHFTYNAEDLAAVKYDAEIFLEAGADGFVFGALTKDGCVDIPACQELLEIVADKPVTFHRAFDWTSNPYDAMEQIITLGFQRILTSGQQDTALNGLSLISDLVEKAENRIIIMPGSEMPNAQWDLKMNLKRLHVVTMFVQWCNHFIPLVRCIRNLDLHILRECKLPRFMQFRKEIMEKEDAPDSPDILREETRRITYIQP
ncbi:hypothetical protein B566_EDAN008481 [Ephemera danica]|nr:hypothetical protein B566_EDAN008481 [Ephemera danica]